MKRTYSILAIAICFVFMATAQDKTPTLQGKKILFTYGGWKGHEPIKCLELLKPWLEAEGAMVDTFSSLEIYADSAYMDNVDLVIQIHTMSKITKAQEKGLLRAVKNGIGMAGWHGGTGDAFRNNVAYQFMIGGQWVAHPGGIIENYPVHIIDSTDYVTAGIGSFTMKKTEQYYMHVDPNIKVLATTTFTNEHAYWIGGGTMPVVWKKYFGKGRIFYISIGHVAADLEVPQVNTMLKRGIRWAAESKYHQTEQWLKPVY